MAISNPVKNASGNWVVTIGQNGSAASKTLSTKNTYVDGDIILNEEAGAAGSHNVSVGVSGSVVTAPAVTPKVDISSTVSGKTESSYGITTTQPTGTGAKYVTFDPNGTGSNGQVEAVADASCTATAGWIAAGTDTDQASTNVSVAPTVNAGTNKYVNVFETGDATVTAVLDPQTSPTTDVTVTVTVPKGITEGFTKTAKFDILGALDVPGASADVRTGKKFYDAQGNVVIGTMGDAVTNLDGPEFGGGSPSSSTTITAVTTAPTRPSAAGDKGAAVNYDGTSGLTNYVTITANGTGGAAAVTATAQVDCVTAGYMAAERLADISGTKAAVSTTSTDTNYIKASTDSSITASAGTISGSTSATATATATATASGSVTTGGDYFLSSGTNSYKVVFEADAEAVAKADATSSGSASASAGADKTLSVKDTYMLNNVAVKSAAIGSTALTGGSATDTKSANDAKELTKYIKAGSYTCTTEGSITANAAASTNMATISKPSSGTEGTDYFSITATPSATGTINGYAEVTAAGWIPTGHASGSSKSAATGSADKKYVAKAVITNNTTLPSGSSSSGTINRGKYIKIAAGYNKTDLYYLAQANSGNVTITQQSGQSVDGYATASVQTGSASVVDKSQTISSDMTISGAITTSGSATVYRVTSAINKEYSGALTGSVSAAGWITSVASANLGVVGSKSLDIAVYNGEVA